jgi:hypothetical protein
MPGGFAAWWMDTAAIQDSQFAALAWCDRCPCPILYLQWVRARVVNPFGPVGDPDPYNGDIVNGQSYSIDIKTRGYSPGAFLDGDCNFTILLPEVLRPDCLPLPIELSVQFDYPASPPPDWILNYEICEGGTTTIDPYLMTVVDAGRDITCTECQPESSAFFELVSTDGLRGNSLELTWKYDYCPPAE